MKKILGIGLAAVLATATVGTTTESAQAGPVGAFVAGVVVGGVFVALADGWRPFARTATLGFAATGPGPDPSDHVAWCRANYRSYQIGSDTYTGYDGVQYACISPH